MSSTASEALPLVAITYSSLDTEDPPLLIAEGARGTCRLAWVLPDAGAVSRGAARMLRGLGEIVDVTGLTVPEAAERLTRQLVDLVSTLRELDLKKAPSISESVDWARTLVALEVGDLDEDAVERTLGVVLKHSSDQDKAVAALRGHKSGARPGSARRR